MVEVEGCFSHFSQANWRQILGLTTQYVEDPEFSLDLKSLIALAFVPVDQVRESFGNIRDDIPPQAEQYVEYFERTYVGRYKSTIQPNGRMN